MENKNYQELIDNLSNPDKVREATTKKASAQETIKKLKEHYHKISHDDYYSAKTKLDQNVKLKKYLREELRKIEYLKDKTTLSDKEAEELTRVEKLIESQNKTPETEKIINEKITEINEKLKELKILIKDLLK